MCDVFLGSDFKMSLTAVKVSCAGELMNGEEHIIPPCCHLPLFVVPQKWFDSMFFPGAAEPLCSPPASAFVWLFGCSCLGCFCVQFVIVSFRLR